MTESVTIFRDTYDYLNSRIRNLEDMIVDLERSNHDLKSVLRKIGIPRDVLDLVILPDIEVSIYLEPGTQTKKYVCTFKVAEHTQY